jgi:hypothetical protein
MVTRKRIWRKVCVVVLAVQLGCAPEQWPEFPGGAVTLNSRMLADDANRDPNWDWTVNTNYTLYVANNPSGPPTVPLPYYANVGPAASELNIGGDRDIQPAHGWRLLLRDFGTPGRSVPVPFFILYNRFRGLMRLFYWSPPQLAFTYAAAKLSFQDAAANGKNGALMTLEDPTNQTVDDYNAGKAQIAIGAVALQQWCYFDFDVSGYDPNLAAKVDPTFKIEIAGVTQTQLVVKGTIDPAQRTVGVHQPNAADGFNRAVGAFETVNKQHKTFDDAKKWIDDHYTKSNAWYARPLQFISGLIGKNWFSALGAAAGLLSYLKGGGGRQSTPLITYGDVNLNGQLTTQAPLYSLAFRVPGTLHNDPVNDGIGNLLPHYDRPLGVFNLLSAPVLEYWVKWQFSCLYFRVRREVKQRLGPNLLQTVVNPDSGLRLEKLEAALHRPNSVPDGYQEGVTDGYTRPCETREKWITDTYPSCDLDRELNLRRVAVRATLSPYTPIEGVEPLIIVKSYSPKAKEVTSSSPASACFSCGDGVCQSGESCSSCPSDCGACRTPVCGDGICDAGESCSVDCCEARCRDGSCCPSSGVCSDGLRCLL